MKILCNTLFAAVLLFSPASATADILISEQEKTAMLNEADDFIDDMPEGLQDRQCDAVLHALSGQGADLQKIRLSRNVPAPVSDAVECSDITPDGTARGISMRLYRPKDAAAPLPLLVYLHGGGWTIGSIASCSRFCDAVAATGKAEVLAVDYSLAPESPFPDGLSDCVEAVRFAASHAGQLGTADNLIFIGGDSSGANLALATALRLGMEADSPAIKGIVAFYPVLKGGPDGSESWRKFSKGYGLDARLMNAFFEAYINGTDGCNSSNGADSVAQDPLMSPADAPDSMLEKLPPLLIVNAGRDILNDQGKDFHARLAKLGNDARRVEFPGAVHLFITVDGQPTAFGKAVALTADFLSR